MTFYERFLDHAAAAFDRQLALNEQIGTWAWELRVDEGLVAFSKKSLLRSSRRTSAVQILGTESQQTGTWRWAWASPQSGIPPALLAAASQLRALGERLGIPELTEPDLPLDHIDGHALALLAIGELNLPAYYRGPYDGGAVFMLIEDGSFRAAVDDPGLRIVQVFPQLISSIDIADHRRAFAAYLRYYGLDVDESAHELRGHGRTRGPVCGSFDELGRLTALQY